MKKKIFEDREFDTGRVMLSQHRDTFDLGAAEPIAAYTAGGGVEGVVGCGAGHQEYERKMERGGHRSECSRQPGGSRCNRADSRHHATLWAEQT